MGEKQMILNVFKTKLLDLFKLSPTTFHTKFVQYQRRSRAMWKNLIFQFRSYLCEEVSLEGLNVTNFVD